MAVVLVTLDLRIPLPGVHFKIRLAVVLKLPVSFQFHILPSSHYLSKIS
jgi:hypothetical protein